MTTVLPPQLALNVPLTNYENAEPYVNGYVREESPGPSHRSTHSASSGEGLSMRDDGRIRTRVPMRSHTQVETNGESDSRQIATPQQAGTRPRPHLQRANTDHGPQGRSPPGNSQASEENWELRHGWEDQYNSSEYLGLLSSVWPLTRSFLAQY